ncbi:MAG: hypothetical protein JSU07_09100 [Bacteroidetes bacterium]|nr:hypothetical protein [Bacteroidota bacterium]
MSSVLNKFVCCPGTPRMTILGTGSANPGFIGIGNGFSTPLNLLHLKEFPTNTGLFFRSDGTNAVVSGSCQRIIKPTKPTFKIGKIFVNSYCEKTKGNRIRF